MREEHTVVEKTEQQDNLFSTLLDSNKQGEIISVFTNLEESQKFSVGVVSEIFENEIIINHYLPNGKYDGFIVKQIDEIYKIEKGSKYLKKIKKLSHLHQAVHDKLEREQDNGFFTLLTYAFNNKKVVSIELFGSENNDAVGFVKKIDGNSCTIAALDEYGEEDGFAIFSIEDITHLSCDGDEEIVLKLLHDARN